MFNSLSTFLKGRLPASLYMEPQSGKRYVIMDAEEYERLTGVSLSSLPQLAEPDIPPGMILESAPEPKSEIGKNVDFQGQISNTGRTTHSVALELVGLELEDEIGVEDLPL